MTFKLTKEILIKYNACDDGIQDFERVFPHGAYLDVGYIQYAMRRGLDLTFAYRHFPEHFTTPQIRNLCLQHENVVQYAQCVDQEPRNDTRKAAIAVGYGYGFDYALLIDKEPRDDTRQAAITSGHAYDYARWIDAGPRDDTRKAAIQQDAALRYAIHVDKEARSDTFQALRGRQYDQIVYMEELDVDHEKLRIISPPSYPNLEAL